MERGCSPWPCGFCYSVLVLPWTNRSAYVPASPEAVKGELFRPGVPCKNPQIFRVPATGIGRTRMSMARPGACRFRLRLNGKPGGKPPILILGFRLVFLTSHTHMAQQFNRTPPQSWLVHMNHHRIADGHQRLRDPLKFLAA